MPEKRNKIGNVPNLRFPEFEGEWEVKKLGEVVEFKAGYAFKSDQMLSERSTYQLIKMSNVYQNELRLDRNPSFWSIIDSKQREFLLKKGDTVLTLTGTVGKQDFGYSVQIKEDDKYLLNQRLVLLRERSNKSKNDFINQLVSNKKFLYAFFGEAKGGTGNQTNVGIEDVKNIVFSFPSLLEQEKIASFLSAIDQRIATQNKIIDRLESLMQVLREKLFTQQIRFKDKNGNSFPEWEVKELGEIMEFIPTNSFSRDNLNYVNGTVKNIHYGDIHTKFQTLFNIKNENVPFINEDISLSKMSEVNYCKEGDIIFADASEDLNDVGKSIEIINLNNEKLLSGLHTLLARPKEKLFHKGFNGYLFKSNNIRTQIQKQAQGTKVLSISAARISKIKLAYPTLSEQSCIADFLSSIDNKISIEIDLLKKIVEQKNFLLQNLFI